MFIWRTTPSPPRQASPMPASYQRRLRKKLVRLADETGEVVEIKRAIALVKKFERRAQAHEEIIQAVLARSRQGTVVQEVRRNSKTLLHPAADMTITPPR